MSEESLGQRVARLRHQLRLNQAELGALIGRSESWVSQVERDLRHIDRLSVREGLAWALQVPLGDLFPPPQGRFTRRELFTTVPAPEPPHTVTGVVSAAYGEILMVRLDRPLEQLLPRGTEATVNLHIKDGGEDDDR